MIKRTVVMTLLGTLLAAGFTLAGKAKKPDAEKPAVAAALSWLDLIDNGNYAGSWHAAAAYLKNAMPLKQWEQGLKAARKPLGKKVSRKVKTAKYATELPGAPDGEYVVIQFQTSFANKKSAIETVTPMKEPDGKWRVSGYYIK
jgi:hypothetical protein